MVEVDVYSLDEAPGLPEESIRFHWGENTVWSCVHSHTGRESSSEVNSPLAGIVIAFGSELSWLQSVLLVHNQVDGC